MSIGGEIVEEYYEDHIIPAYKQRISDLEAKIRGFGDILEQSDCTAGGTVVVELPGGEYGEEIVSAYKEYFGLK